jgi:glucose-6-phosphate isomerase
MNGSFEPFSTQIALDGSLEPERRTDVRRISDIRSIYQDVTADMEDRLVYSVHHMPVPETGSEIQCSTTVLLPGTVGAEYFMTKGHFHEVRDRSEIYLGLAGEGLLVLATESGEHRMLPMRQGTVAYVPGGWAHRAANTGSEPFIFFAAFVGDAGHDYETVARHGFPVIIVKGEQGPQVVANPRYARPLP